MRIDLRLANDTNIFLQYEQFKVVSAKDKYKLTVGGFKGTTTDPMAYHNGMFFSTKDNDNDPDRRNCAIGNKPSKPSGGWWHRNCWQINPNIFHNHDVEYGTYLNNKWHIVPFIEMKIRPHNCNI